MEVYVGKQFKFPARITPTRLWPDMIILSDFTTQLIMLDLTVPWEEHMDEANKRKSGQELVEDFRGQGWRTRGEPLEVGCRGFAGHSLSKVFMLLEAK